MSSGRPEDKEKTEAIESAKAAQTIEQMCRDLLEIAIRDGLVSETKWFERPNPQQRSSGELAGMANRLSVYLRAR